MAVSKKLTPSSSSRLMISREYASSMVQECRLFCVFTKPMQPIQIQETVRGELPGHHSFRLSTQDLSSASFSRLLSIHPFRILAPEALLCSPAADLPSPLPIISTLWPRMPTSWSAF